MKRLIVCIAMLCIVMLDAVAKDFNPQPVITIPGYHADIAWNGQEIAIATYESNGKDVTYTILGNDLKIQKTFTLKNIIQTETIDNNGEPFEYTLQGPTTPECEGVTRSPLVAVRNIFTNDGKWCVFIFNYLVDDKI